MQDDTFKTIQAPSEGFYKDRGSKFLSFAFPITSEEHAQELYAQLRSTYKDARHIPYAYRIGTTGQQYRANDDGEPSNSAGKPILGQIDAFDLTNVLIAVVRYFGGTLLGVGGLISAFRTAAQEALKEAIIEEKTIDDTIDIRFEYPDMSHVMRIIKETNAQIVSQKLELSCYIRVALRRSHTASFLARFEPFYQIKLSQPDSE